MNRPFTTHVRINDRLWLWGHPAGSHNCLFSPPAASRITPVEAACYLGLDNLLFITYPDNPAVEAFSQHAISFRPLEQVIWSITGADGVSDEGAVARVVDLAKRFPNLSGVVMDDFFRGPLTGVPEAVFSTDQLRVIQSQLVLPDRKLDLWVALYLHQLYEEHREPISLCDVLTFWTWKASDLVNMEATFSRAELLAPCSRKVLGCYMYDYGTGQPMPTELMQHQYETGLHWLHEGRIEGMIFLASCICDLDLEAVEWTRRWIAELGKHH